VPLDPLTLRPGFPALGREVAGRPAAFLDGPGGSQAHGSAIAAMAGYLRARQSNDGGAFVTSLETAEVVAAARAAAADLVGAAPAEIAFGASMTALNFALAHAVGRTLRAGDEIVVTALDHDANVAPWLRVAEDRGLVVRHAPICSVDATLAADAVEALLTDRTRVVAFTLASNAVGSVPDAARIAAAAHDAGALAWADAVHFAPHRRLDRAALGLDVLLCSPYKFFGPHLGVAALRRDLAENWPADRVRPAAQDPPGHRFELGTPSFEALAGATAAIDYVAGLGEGATRPARLDDAFARIRTHEEAVAVRALERLGAIDGCRVYGLADPADVARRTPTLCFTVDRLTPRAVAEALAAEGIFVWDGNYYALDVMRALGLEDHGGAVRAGFLHYNTLEEADRLGDAVARIAGG